MFDANQLYDQAEVAKALGKSTAWAERSRWDGSGPKFVKIGRKVAYRGSDLNDWIEGHVCSSTANRARA